MDIFKLDNDINVFCITAKSFPEGVLEAHQTLHALIPFDTNRKYFGLSRPDQTGTIVYKAAAEELVKGELSKHNLETFIIKKGDYLYIDVNDFMQDTSSIGKAFGEIIADERIDPDGICVEWYITQNNCKCMVRLK